MGFDCRGDKNHKILTDELNLCSCRTGNFLYWSITMELNCYLSLAVILLSLRITWWELVYSLIAWWKSNKMNQNVVYILMPLRDYLLVVGSWTFSILMAHGCHISHIPSHATCYMHSVFVHWRWFYTLMGFFLLH